MPGSEHARRSERYAISAMASSRAVLILLILIALTIQLRIPKLFSQSDLIKKRAEFVRARILLVPKFAPTAFLAGKLQVVETQSRNNPKIKQ